MAITKSSDALILVSKQNGVVIIPPATPLTRLNYFDGKFLRARDLKAEQDYLRHLVRQSNQAGGSGVAHGFDLTLGGGDLLNIGAGLAIDPDGRVLLLPQETAIGIQELIEKSRDLQGVFGKASVKVGGEFQACELAAQTPPLNTPRPGDLYLITIASAEALCGEEDVFGKLCEEACATSTDRPFLLEGLIVRAIPLILRTPLPASKAVALAGIHLRSRVASAYFEDERQVVASLISKSGLEQETWCLGAAAMSGGSVPIGVIARAGTATIFLDAWIARRERIDAPAKRYWQWRMMMRPWDVFLAQVLQFQCQLHDLFRKTPTPGGETDPCGDARGVISEATQAIAELRKYYEAASKRFTVLRNTEPFAEEVTFAGGMTRLAALNNRLALAEQNLSVVPQDRLLIRGGIIELPSAGYLPVAPSANLTINQQVRQMMGEGVDLRFCVVRHDYVAHALEEAQHMERISLTQGLDDPKNKPQVDILVPDGQIIEQKRLSPGLGFDAKVAVSTALLIEDNRSTKRNLPPLNFRGAARSEVLPSGGGAIYLSSAYEAASFGFVANVEGVNLDNNKFINTLSATSTSRRPTVGLWVSLRTEHNVFALGRGDTTSVNARAVIGSDTLSASDDKEKGLVLDVELNAIAEVIEEASFTGNARTATVRFRNAQVSFFKKNLDGSGTDEPDNRKPTFVDFDATVTLTKESQIEILIFTAKTSLLNISANWGKKPLEAEATISLSVRAATASSEGESKIPLAESSLKENEDVLSAKNANHALALKALEAVAAALGSASFADAKAKLLFPPPPKPTDELIVRGTRDWVLFHRRRNKQCSEEVVAPAPAPARLYQVYHLKVGSLQEAARAAKELIEGKIPVDKLDKLPIVEFGGGVATLQSNTAEFRKDWEDKQPGNLLVYAAIGNRESAAADGEALALARLGRLEDVVAPVSKPDPQLQSEVLKELPPSAQSSGVDGAIFMFTVSKVETTCATVYRVPANMMPFVRRSMESGDMDSALGQTSAQLIGEVNFKADTADASDDSLQNAVKKWKDLGDGQTELVLAVTSATDTTVSGQLASSQSAAIGKALNEGGTTTPTVTSAVFPKQFPTSIRCPVVVFVAPVITRQALLVFARPDGDTHFLVPGVGTGKVTFINNAPQGTALGQFLKGLSATALKSIHMADVTDPGDADMQLRLNAAVKAVVDAGGPPGVKTQTGALSKGDQEELTKRGIKVTDFDEVFYFNI